VSTEGIDRGCLPNTVRIGGVDKPDLLSALRAHQVGLNQAAEALFEDARFTTLPHGHVIEIACVSVAELGFADGATYGQVTARAVESGLVECPLEVGPHLRLQFLEQPDSGDGSPLKHGRAPAGSITVASSPLDENDDTPKGFYLRRVDGVLWLRGYWSWAGHVWSPTDLLLFARVRR